ncbi:MAG: hypothetical protein H6719_05470 [Sandaracinaceae bacterium]|nr:hypothetical protein [Sandaracinaceae bacterium]
MTAVMRATTQRAPGPRWVRWAVVRDGVIELERVTDPDHPITMGASGDVPTSGPTRTLLAFERGGWVLRATPGLRGRTEAGSLEALTDGGTRDLELDDSTRARIEVGGGASLLVQLVDRPPAKLKPQLPASLRGGLLSGADWWFTSFVAASFCLHLGVVAYLIEADWPVETSLVPDRYAELIYPDPPLPPEEDTPEMDEGDEIADATDDVGEDAPPSDATPTPARNDTPRSRPSNNSSSADSSIDPDAIARNVAEQLVIAGIAPGSGRPGAFDALRNGADTQSAASVFDVVDGNGVATTDDGVLHERDGNAVATVTRGLGDLDRRPGVGTGRRPEGRPVEEVEVVVPRGTPPPIFGTPEPDDPGFDSRELIRALRGRMAAVQRCYEHVLSHGDPDASGRITLTMEVMPPGHLQGVRASTNTTGSDALAACVVRSIQTVRVRTGPEFPVRVDFPVVLARQN